MTHALLDNDNVVKGVSPTPFDDIPSGLRQIEVDPPGPIAGQLYDPGTKQFRNPTPVLDTLRTLAKSKVVSYAEQLGQRLKAGYPPSEIQAWSIKESAARAILADTAKPEELALIEAEASMTGEDVKVLSKIIVEKADKYRNAVGVIAGVRRSTEAAIDFAGSPQQIDEVMTKAKTRADALMVQIFEGLRV